MFFLIYRFATLLALDSIIIRYRLLLSLLTKCKSRIRRPMNTRKPQPLTSRAADNYSDLCGQRVPQHARPMTTSTIKKQEPADSYHSRVTKHFAQNPSTPRTSEEIPERPILAPDLVPLTNKSLSPTWTALNNPNLQLMEGSTISPRA